MFGAEFFENFGAGGRLIPQCFTAYLLFEGVNDFREEIRADKRERLEWSQMPAISQWPVVVSLPGEWVAALPKLARGAEG